MKISTMFIIGICLVTLGSLTAFNYQLKKVYLSGEYKSRFTDMSFTPVKGIENIDIHAANLLGVQIEQGDKEGVWINRRVKNNVVFNVNRDTLIMDLTPDSRAQSERAWKGEVIVITKKLNAVVTSSYFSNKLSESYPGVGSSVKGYQSDNFYVQLCQNVNISLNGMQLHTLHAIVGDKVKGGAELILSGDNQIDTAQLDVPGKSSLTLLDPKIVKTNYNLSDSAAVSLSGKMIKMIK
ncbi:hypothetical protein [Pedobacter sp. L105]|uniref:hypothetical protein n=1 Tax=Pedobacter sp. L105 TaxID=1641871 RepID=UPI00131C9888|nr:hypothetical protein [Pedobacter sp. L105]